MNYFELYPGDYLRDTTRLSLVEHGAYLRLLMAYYSDEQPLPAEKDALFRVVSALNSVEKKAVLEVANRFFPVGEDGLRHNARADAEISKAGTRMESKGDKKSTEAQRQQRYRDRRHDMFEALARVGVVPKFNISMDDLTDLVTQNVTQQTVTNVTQRDALHTATRPQTPYTKHQEQELSSSSASPQDTPARNDDDEQPVPGEQDLPSWVPRSLWREFYRHRAVIRKPLSISGQRQIVARLVELSEQGHDVASSLRQTMAAGLAIPVEPRSRASPNGAPRTDSKTLTGLKKLQGLKTDETLPTRVAAERNSGRLIEAHDAES